MKKRFLAILCILTTLLGILAATAAAADDSGKIYVGYAKTDINPWVDENDHTKGIARIPLAGYSTPYRRLAAGRLDDNGDGKVDDNDGLFATCVAVKDEDGKLLLFISYDFINAEDTTVSKVRTQIMDALGDQYDITPEQIMISASHSHYSPYLDYSRAAHVTNGRISEETRKAVEDYRTYLYKQMTLAATNAVEDLKEVSEISKSTTDASDATGYYMNTVRHYTMTAQSGNSERIYYAGDNFGGFIYASESYGSTHPTMAGYKVTSVKQVTEANDQMHLLKFSFDDGSDPVLLLNWRAHTTMNRNSTCEDPDTLLLNSGLTVDGVMSEYNNTSDGIGYYCVSSSYVNALRYQLEQMELRVSFIQGASGNINSNSKESTASGGWSQNTWEKAMAEAAGIKTENSNGTISRYIDAYEATVIVGNVYGELLSQVAAVGLESKNMTKCAFGSIQTMQVRYAQDYQVFEDELPGLLYAAEAYQEKLNQYLAGNISKPTTPFVYSYEGKNYIINSEFHARAVVNRAKALANDSFSETLAKLELNAIMIGPDLAFVSAPIELYDYYDAAGSTNAADNDWLDINSDKNGGSYGTPFVLGYSNGSHGYLPNTKAYQYNRNSGWFGTGAYGANTAECAKGSGEKVIAAFGKMLKVLNGTSEDGFRTGYCQHCKTDVQWKPYLAENAGSTYIYSGHYYLVENIDSKFNRQKTVEKNNEVCLDLNGFTIDSQHKTYGRAFLVDSGAKLNIMDSTGGGYISGQGSTYSDSNSDGVNDYFPNGAVIFIYGSRTVSNVQYAKAELNLYSGTIQRRIAENHSTDNGGTIYASGILNVMGGTIKGGKAEKNGGTIYCTESGALNMSGGRIEEGEAVGNPNAVRMTYNFNMSGGTIAGEVYLAASTRNSISGKSVIAGGAGSNLNIPSGKTIAVGDLEPGSNISVTATGIFTDANGASANNAQYFTGDAGCYVSPTPGGMFAGDRGYCECGGTQPVGHTCETVAWKEWTSTTTLPTANGNYYLTGDVTTVKQSWYAGTTTRIDLNGHDVTYKLPVYDSTEVSGSKKQTRVIHIYKSCDVVLTDTSGTPGTISRDLSNWTDEQIATIDNWGLLLIIDGQTGGENVASSATMYNVILDGTLSDDVSNGYSLVSVHNALSTFKMYSGEIRGGNTRGIGAVKVEGKMEVYGGMITAGSSSSSSYGDCVDVYSDGRLQLSGDPYIDEIYFRGSDYTQSLAVKDAFTGEADLRFAKAVSLGQDVGTSINADVSGGFIAVGDNMCVDAMGEDMGIYEYRNICQCGGTQPIRHTCQDLNWKPWVKSDALPTSGNYYLANSVVTAAQTSITANSTACIDLNGKNITYKIPQSNAASACVFTMSGANSHLVITDSTKNPGTISRDVSLLTQEQVNAISNSGLIALINNNTADMVLFNGVLDSDGAVTTGAGGAVCLNTSGATFTMYGGAIKGAKANQGGGAIYVVDGAQAKLYGGVITGGEATEAGRGNCVHISDGASVWLAGNTAVEELYFVASDCSDDLTILGTYTGSVILRYYNDVSENMVIGISDSADLSGAKLTCANNGIMEVVVSGGTLKLILDNSNVTAIVYENGIPVNKYASLQDAVNNAATNSTIVLWKDYSNSVSVPSNKTISLDLNSFDISNVQVDGVLYVKDSATDSFNTVAGAYGKITGTIGGSGKVLGVPVEDGVAYVKVVEDDGVSFHCLKLKINSAGVYSGKRGMNYFCDFKGDQWATAQVASFGVAVSITGEPTQENGEFASHCAVTVLTDFASVSKGDSVGSSTIKNILDPERSYNLNRGYANVTIYGKSYVMLTDGTCLMGTPLAYSFRDVYEHASDGVDSEGKSIWDNYFSYSDKTSLISLYEKFASVMKDWKITKLLAERDARAEND